ncbi:hypothetical protein B0H11DRAFT_1909191 [Mycena galericulata]|nr:hypothetical protein B0H11DRAFT_1909191 [Mycena galericulata]
MKTHDIGLRLPKELDTKSDCSVGTGNIEISVDSRCSYTLEVEPIINLYAEDLGELPYRFRGLPKAEGIAPTMRQGIQSDLLEKTQIRKASRTYLHRQQDEVDGVQDPADGGRKIQQQKTRTYNRTATCMSGISADKSDWMNMWAHPLGLHRGNNQPDEPSPEDIVQRDGTVSSNDSKRFRNCHSRPSLLASFIHGTILAGDLQLPGTNFHYPGTGSNAELDEAEMQN